MARFYNGSTRVPDFILERNRHVARARSASTSVSTQQPRKQQTRPERTRAPQPNHAKEPPRIAIVSARRSGASQYSLCGRLTNSAGALEIRKGTPKVSNDASATAPAKNVRKVDFAC